MRDTLAYSQRDEVRSMNCILSVVIIASLGGGGGILNAGNVKLRGITLPTRFPLSEYSWELQR
jgi:hypothetical protein